MAEVKTKQVKIKKKHWVPIFAPKSFNTIPLGETLVDEAAKVKQKSVTTSLMVLTDDPRKQGYNVRFDVVDVKDGKAHTQVIGMDMAPSAIKRLIRRHRDKISDSFTVRIGGGRIVRVKPLLITKTKASGSAQTKIRLMVREMIREMYQKMRFDDIIMDIVDGKLQRHLREVCSRTHPIRSMDVREIVILPEGRAMTQQMVELMEQEAAEEEQRRAQLANAAAAAGVDEEEAPKRKAPARKKKVAEETSEEDSDDDDE